MQPTWSPPARPEPCKLRLYNSLTRNKVRRGPRGRAEPALQEPQGPAKAQSCRLLALSGPRVSP